MATARVARLRETLPCQCIASTPAFLTTPQVSTLAQPLAAQADRHRHPVVQWHIDWHAFLLPGGVRAGTFRLMRAECRVLAGTFRLMRAECRVLAGTFRLMRA